MRFLASRDNLDGNPVTRGRPPAQLGETTGGHERSHPTLERAT